MIPTACSTGLTMTFALPMAHVAPRPSRLGFGRSSMRAVSRQAVRTRSALPLVGVALGKGYPFDGLSEALTCPQEG